ncbi:MAG TPA: M20/M25/M40 family metallo-hydrolase, partial [Candidatus Acidoferrum sp.]|nr:M20/M25/M40 family metallo-hydrolase [Candidatus Acidoferrum sp.]
MTIDSERTRTFVQQAWDRDIVPALTEYIRIPAKSPMFDAQWAEHGHIDRAVELITGWARGRRIEGLRIEVVRIEGRTPVILMEAPGAGGDTVLLYGHCDKQPEMVGWAADGGPWIPVRRGDRLFGRGAGDDGYAAFAALTAIEALEAQGVPHARCVVLIEGSEESGSPDLPAYVEKLADRIRPGLVVCLDSGCGDYDHLWATTSLRGVLSGTLTVEVLREGVHSGAASGIVPSSFRILRNLLGRIEDERSGEILIRECHVAIPPERAAEVRAVAGVLGDEVIRRYPFMPGMHPVTADPVEALLNNTWRPALAVIGADGIPAVADGGNVLRPQTSLKLSLRLPPTADGPLVARRMKEMLEADPPYGATVTFTPSERPGGGWNAPVMADWLSDSVKRASSTYFGKPAMFDGLGGSIPFMAMLGERFPQSQFLVTGVMGPGSNAHGPNEFI